MKTPQILAEKIMKKKRVRRERFKTVFRGKIFNVQQAKATYPSGIVKVHERVTRQPMVAILAIDSKGRLLLTREYRLQHHGYRMRLPGGLVDKGLSPKQAAQQELREETGYRARSLKLFYTSELGSSVQCKRYFYIAKGLVRAPLQGDEDEDITVVPTTIQKAHKMVLDGTITNEAIGYAILKLFRRMKK